MFLFCFVFLLLGPFFGQHLMLIGSLERMIFPSSSRVRCYRIRICGGHLSTTAQAVR